MHFGLPPAYRCTSVHAFMCTKYLSTDQFVRNKMLFCNHVVHGSDAVIRSWFEVGHICILKKCLYIRWLGVTLHSTNEFGCFDRYSAQLGIVVAILHDSVPYIPYSSRLPFPSPLPSSISPSLRYLRWCSSSSATASTGGITMTSVISTAMDADQGEVFLQEESG